MDKNDIASRVLATVRHALGLDDQDAPHVVVTVESTFAELEMDDLDRVEVAMNIEEVFEIDIDDEHLDKFTKVQDFIDFVAQKLSPHLT